MREEEGDIEKIVQYKPIVGTECDTVVIEPGICKLFSKCVFPDPFGPRQRQDGVIIATISSLRNSIETTNCFLWLPSYHGKRSLATAVCAVVTVTVAVSATATTFIFPNTICPKSNIQIHLFPTQYTHYTISSFDGIGYPHSFSLSPLIKYLQIN